MPVRGRLWYVSGGALRRRGFAPVSLGGFVADTFVLGTTRPVAANTGADTSLITSTVTGNQTYSTNNQVIENVQIDGNVIITGTNVTLRNCLIRGQATYGYPGYSGTVDARASGWLLDRCTIRPRAAGYFSNAINGAAAGGAKRCDISQAVDLFSMKGNNYAEGCYMHDQVVWDGKNTTNGNGTDHATDSRFPGWSHNDCAQIYGGANNRVEGCNMVEYFHPTLGTPSTFINNPDGYSNGRNFPLRNYDHGILIGPNSGVVTNCQIVNNWFEGGEVGLQLTKQSKGFDTGNSFVITGNRFGLDQKPGYSTNASNPYTAIDMIESLWTGGGSMTFSGNTFDVVSSVPAALRGQNVTADAANTFYSSSTTQRKYQVNKS